MAHRPRTPTTEKRVLARLLLSQERSPEIGILTLDDFHNPYRRTLFEAFRAVSRRTKNYDEMTVLNEAKKLLGDGSEHQETELNKVFEEIIVTGGTANLEEDIANLKTYTCKRKLVDIGEKAIIQSKESSPDVIGIIDELARVQAGGVTVPDMGNVVEDSLRVFEKRWEINDEGGDCIGLTSAIGTIDHCTAGFLPGEVVVVAGRPASGKTSLLLQQAHTNSIEKDKKIVYFSLEMQRYEVVQRMIAQIAEFESQRITRPTSEEDKEKVRQELEKIKQLPFKLIDDKFYVEDIISTGWLLKETEGLDGMFIDYLQLVNTRKGGFQSDNSRISFISRQIKMLSQQLEIPIIIGSQLNRRVERRQDQKPKLSDLRSSGSIEQDASIVLMLYYHDAPDNSERERITDGIFLSKNRRGPAGLKVDVYFEADKTKFYPQAPEYYGKEEEKEQEGMQEPVPF